MTLEELKQRYMYTIPFVESEIKDEILQASFRDAVNYYNKYCPNVKKELVDAAGSGTYTFIGTAPDAVLRIYFHTINYDPSIDNLMIQWDYKKPDLTLLGGTYDVVTVYPWTLDDINLDYHDLLSDLIKCELIMAMSNRRRMAALNELPLDFKG
ncbi:MAG: hypothetical protein GY861_11620, partial [bacterium]|nr:hypothetical protein [bacterium]